MVRAKYNICIFLLWSCLLLTACQAAERVRDETDSYRTYYDSLNLDTPEAAIETFAHALQRHDYSTVYMILAPAAQQLLRTNRDLLQYGEIGVVTEGSPPRPSEEFSLAMNKTLLNIEHIYDMFHSFDRLLVTAAEHSALQIHLPGSVTILDTNNSITTSGQIAIDVTTQVEGIDGIVIFRMVQSPAQKWRVFQVIWPHGNEDKIPWAISADMETAPAPTQPVTIHYPRTYYDALALDTPKTAVHTFTQAFQQEDFPTVFWILHWRAQREWSMNFGMNYFENLVDTNNPSQIFWNTEFGQNLHALEESGAIDRDEGFFTFLEASNSLGYRGSPYTPLVMEHIGDRSYLFDQVMLAADGRYLIDLTRPITIHETHIRRGSNDDVTATVTTTVEGIEGTVTFKLKQTSTGPWRVLQVIVPGGDEDKYPWAVP
jgi:hypothetical protein